ncbi:hypothetical protein N7519_008177 [Penicillium mononematosum]|uniref:uncharacterized protein n=1 Tax=Penicillium mononematosum TaxID=268346 RepID=UPI002549BF6B|nr:uncharacterized protein N7519_008177 [Penicillium mononematosum]KAJ6177716.1 hypothetical protein N7519_008177 [Penicillium mononematosum]
MDFNEFARAFDEPSSTQSSLDSNSALGACSSPRRIVTSIHFAREGIELVSIGVSSKTAKPVLLLWMVFFVVNSEPVTEGDFKAKGCKGTVLNDETLGDFVINHYGLLSRALTTAGTKACVYGDKPENHRAGSSPSRNVLAHGTELDVTSPDYFVLTIELLSSFPSDLAKQRLQYVRDVCHLDPNQEETFTKSTTEYRENYKSRLKAVFNRQLAKYWGYSLSGSTTGFLTRVSHENFARNMCRPW